MMVCFKSILQIWIILTGLEIRTILWTSVFVNMSSNSPAWLLQIYLRKSQELHLSPLILQKIKEDDISQLSDYKTPLLWKLMQALVLLYLFVQNQLIPPSPNCLRF